MGSMAQWKFLHHRHWGVLDVVHREVPDALCNVLHQHNQPTASRMEFFSHNTVY